MRKKLYILIACALLFVQILVQINLASSDAQTSDEAIHLFSGYIYLTQNNFRYNPEHPPLMKYLAALPLLFQHPNLPAGMADYEKKFQNFYFFGNDEQIQLGTDFLYHSGNNQNNLLFTGRLMMIAVTLLLGLAVWLISVYFWGWGGGLISVVLFTTDPLINGHGHIITNDILLSLTTLLSIFFFWLFLKDPSWKKAIIFGFLLSLAQLSKFSALILYPLTFIVLIAYVIWYQKGGKVFWNYLCKFIVAIFISYVLIIAFYGFKMTPAPLVPSVSVAIDQANDLPAGLVPRISVLEKTYPFSRFFFVPREYYFGLAAFLLHAADGHDAYLFGQLSNKGWWYYFPILISAKTPLVTLAIIIMAFIYFVRKKRSDFALLLLFVIFFELIFSMMSKVDIGLRHIAPAYALLFVFAGIIGENLWVYGLLFIFFIQSLFFINPYYLSFFNVLYGGTWNGYKTAVDSNLDWGQDGLRIQKYINDHKLQNVYLEYWNGNKEKFVATKGANLIIGATSLFENVDFAWLKNIKPTAQITPSVFLFSF